MDGAAGYFHSGVEGLLNGVHAPEDGHGCAVAGGVGAAGTGDEDTQAKPGVARLLWLAGPVSGTFLSFIYNLPFEDFTVIAAHNCCTSSSACMSSADMCCL